MWHNKGCQTTLAWSHTLGINQLHAEWQKNYSHTHRGKSGGVCSQGLSAQEHFITPAVLPDCRQTHTGTRWEWMLHTGESTILISGILPNNVWDSSGGFEYGTSVVWQNFVINLSTKKFGTWINILWNRVTYTKSLLASYCTLFKVWGCKVHKHKGCTKKISVVQLHGQLLCLPFLYSTLRKYWIH